MFTGASGVQSPPPIEMYEAAEDEYRIAGIYWRELNLVVRPIAKKKKMGEFK